MRIVDKIAEMFGRTAEYAGEGFHPELRQSTKEAAVASAIKKKPYNKILAYKEHLFDEATCESVASSPLVQEALSIRIKQELTRKQTYRATAFADSFHASSKTIEEIRESKVFYNLLLDRVRRGEIYESDRLIEKFAVPDTFLKREEFQKAATIGVIKATRQDLHSDVFEFGRKYSVSDSIYASQEFKVAAIEGLKSKLQSGSFDSARWFLEKWEKEGMTPLSVEDKQALIAASIKGLPSTLERWNISLFQTTPDQLRHFENFIEKLDGKEQIRSSSVAQRVRDAILEKIIDSDLSEYNLTSALQNLEDAIPLSNEHILSSKLASKVRDRAIKALNEDSEYYFSQILSFVPTIFSSDESREVRILAIETLLKAGKFSQAQSYAEGLSIDRNSLVLELGFEKQLEEGIAILVSKKAFNEISEIRRSCPKIVDKVSNEEYFRKAICEVLKTNESDGLAFINKFYVPPSEDEFGIIAEEDFGKPEFLTFEFEKKALQIACKLAIAHHDRNTALKLFGWSGGEAKIQNTFTEEHFEALCKDLVSDRAWEDQLTSLEWHADNIKGRSEFLEKKEGAKLPTDIWLKKKLSSEGPFTEKDIEMFTKVKTLYLYFGNEIFIDLLEKDAISVMSKSSWECFTDEVEELAKSKLIQTIKIVDASLLHRAYELFPFTKSTLENKEVKDSLRDAIIECCNSKSNAEDLNILIKLYNPTLEERSALEPFITSFLWSALNKGEMSEVFNIYRAQNLPESIRENDEFKSCLKNLMRTLLLSDLNRESTSAVREFQYKSIYYTNAEKSEEFQKFFALTIKDLEEYLEEAIKIGAYPHTEDLINKCIHRDRRRASDHFLALKDDLLAAASRCTEQGNFSSGFNFLKLADGRIEGNSVEVSEYVDRTLLLDSIRKGFRYILEVDKDPSRALGLLADLSIIEEQNLVINDRNLFGFSPAVLAYAEQEEIKTLKELLTEFKSDPILINAIAEKSELLSDKKLREKGKALGLSRGETVLALQEKMNLDKMSDADYLRIVDICANAGGDWADAVNIRGPFAQGAKIFGATRMFRYLSPLTRVGAPARKISRHDALHAFRSIIQLFEKSGLTKDEFYNQILDQVRRSNATYNAGTAYHRLNEIAQTAKLDIEEVINIASQYPDVSYLSELMENFNSNEKVFEKWKSLERFSKLAEYIKRVEMLELIQELKNSGDGATASYVETLAFHPHSSVDLSAVEKFARNIEAFLDLEDQHTPATVHKVKKPSNLFKFDNLNLNPEDLRKALVYGYLDSLQRILPMSASYKVTESGELYSVRGEIRRALGSRARGIPGKAKDVKALFHKIKNDLFKEADINFEKYLSGEIDGLPRELHEKFLNLIYDPKIGVKPPALKTVVVRIHPKSSPDAVLAGDDTACCMKFGSGKANVYTFNLSCVQMTVQVETEVEDAPLRTIAQSILTPDIDIEKAIPDIVSELQSADLNLSEILPASVVESGKRFLAADNVEVNLNYKTPEWGQTLEVLYSDFFNQYMKRYGENGNYNTSIAPVGMGYSDALTHMRTATNTYAPEAPVGYSDKLGPEVYMLDIKAHTDLLGVTYEEYEDTTEIKEERAGVSTATFSDTIPISYLESKIYADNTSLIENLHRIENRFFAVAISNALNGYPDLSLKYTAKNKVLGYISAHQGIFNDMQHDLPLEKDEPIIYVADLAVHPDAVTAVPRILSEFCDRYKASYLDKGEFIPMFAQLREKTSYKLLKQKVDWLEQKLGCELEFIEGTRYEQGADTMVPVVIRPKRNN